ncbi:sensor histidine kinase [Arthrospiribacter ruber]|nr:histidine kinase [Arthrospiribacter ruber]
MKPLNPINSTFLPRFKRIVMHMAFWLSYLLYHTFLFGYMRQEFLHPFKWELYDLPLKILASYFVVYVLIPKYLIHKKIWQFVISLILTLLIASFLQRVFHSQFIGRFIEPEQEYFTLYPTTALVFKTVISIYPIVVVVALIKILKYWYEADRKHQQMQKDKIEAELNFLKTQINPHFLFNTLNSLYALTLKQSDQASKVVLKLSQLLNYLIYESNKKTVPLPKELEQIKTYISLEKVRFGDRLVLDYTEKGESKGVEIPPLLILPLVENCFKHGAGKQLDDVWVNIQVIIGEKDLEFSIHNSKESQNATSNHEHDGIGLQNVQKRLKLIYGKGNYKIDFKDQGDSYLVKLKLKTERAFTDNQHEIDLLYY